MVRSKDMLFMTEKVILHLEAEDCEECCLMGRTSQVVLFSAQWLMCMMHSKVTGGMTGHDE